MVVLDSSRAVCCELSKSAAGGQELWAQVGHLLVCRVDGTIDVLRQLLIIFHYLQDLTLGKSQSTQRSMVSNAAGGTMCPLPFSHHLMCRKINNSKNKLPFHSVYFFHWLKRDPASTWIVYVAWVAYKECGFTREEMACERMRKSKTELGFLLSYAAAPGGDPVQRKMTCF